MNRLRATQPQSPDKESSPRSADIPRLKVAVDATCWQNNRGYGRHARNLLSELIRLDTENRYSFIVDSKEMLDSIPANVDGILVNSTKPTAQAASSDGRRAFADMRRISRAISQPDFDLILFPTVYSYVPVFSRAHTLVFIHDVIAEKYPDLTLPSLSARLAWTIKVRTALYQAKTIVTVSEFSKLGIIETFKVAADQVKVVGEAPSPVFKKLTKPRGSASLPEPLREGQRHIVYVGGFGPHKNLSRLLEVFARLACRADFSNLYLVMVGEYKSEVFYSEYADLKQKIADLGIEERVLFTGYLPDEALVGLLNQADLLVLPSLLEGYGLPAVEAAACGCPVVATNASPLPDLLGEGALYVDPHNSASIEEALTRALASKALRDKMSLAGLQAVEKLTWERAALDLKALIGSIHPS